MGELTGVHIGRLIEKKLKDKGYSVAWLAEQIHCERANVYKIFKKVSIDSVLLFHISLVLETNFFEYYSGIYEDICKNE